MAEASSSERDPLLHSRQSSVDETETPALPAPEIEQAATERVNTDTLGLGGDATNDPNVEVPKTSFNDFWTWLWKTLLVKMFGRSKFQVFCSSLLFLVSVGMFITQFINQSSQIKLAFNVLALCLFLIFLGNNSLTNHDLLAGNQKFIALSLLELIHAGPQLINVFALILKAFQTSDLKKQHAWATAAVEDIVGSLVIKLLLLPGFARIMYAIGRRGELWWAPDPSEFHFSFDCSIIVFEAAMFASTELALYAIRPAQSGEHRDSLQTILRTPEDNNLLSDRAIYAVMVTLAVLLALVPVVTRVFIYLELRAQLHHGRHGTRQGDPASTALENIPLGRLSPIRRRGVPNLDGADDLPEGRTPHPDFTLLDLSIPNVTRFFPALGAGIGNLLNRIKAIGHWTKAVGKTWNDTWYSIQVLVSVCFLIGNVILVGYFAYQCASWAEKLEEERIFNGVHFLGFFLFPATELFAFFPLLRESWNGEFAAALIHSYRSAGLTFTLSPVIVIVAAGIKGRQYFLDLSTLQVVAVLATALISVLSTAFMNGQARLGHLLSGLLMVLLAVISPLAAYLLDVAAAASHAHGGGEGA